MLIARVTILALVAVALSNDPGVAGAFQNGVSVDEPTSNPKPETVTPPQRPALAVLVNFDTGPSYCAFFQTTALRDEYAGVGVRFTGPDPTDGGAILHECGTFSVSGYSPPHFVAFNSLPGATMSDGGTPIGPERMEFTADVASVQVGVAGNYGGVATLTALSAGMTVLASASLDVASNMQTLVVSSPGIRFVTLDVQGAKDDIWVFDDLSFDAMPTPVHATTWGQLKTTYR